MTKIISNKSLNEIQHPISLVEPHQQKKSCCGDCKGQGSCHKVTQVSNDNRIQNEIAPINK